PNPLPNGEVLVYAAMGNGIYRSQDTGRTWKLLQSGVASDVALAAGSKDISGNAQVLYGAIESQGIFYTTSAPSAVSMSLRPGGQGNGLRIYKLNGNTVQIPVNNAPPTPGAGQGRMVLAVPALTGESLKDDVYSGWLYVAVEAGGSLQGIFKTKDFGLNWTQVRIPGVPPPPPPPPPTRQTPTNDDTQGDYDPLSAGGLLGGQGNYDIALAIDPTNPNVIYLSGMGGAGSNGKAYGTIRIDTTATL